MGIGFDNYAQVAGSLRGMIKFITALFPSWATTPRSPRWPTVRKKFMDGQSCQACGVSSNLECHHIKAFHEHPDLELDPSNLIALCRDCHWFIGHLQHWDQTNPEVIADARYFLKRCQEVLGPEETNRAGTIQDQSRT